MASVILVAIVVVMLLVDMGEALKLIDNFGLGLPLRNQYQVTINGFSNLAREPHPFIPQPVHSRLDNVHLPDSYLFPEMNAETPAHDFALLEVPALQDTTGYISNSPNRLVRASAKRAPSHKKRLVKRTKKKKKKNKIMFKYANTAISGGSRLKKTFRSLKDCMSACNKRPNCLSADYNKKTGFCYTHYDTTCNTREAQHGTIHFSKIPCASDLDVAGGLNAELYIGVHRDNGRLDKSVKSFGQCMKKCLNMGNGLANSVSTIREDGQVCSAIDYDFAQHKCYYHTRLRYSHSDTAARMTRHICRVDFLTLTDTDDYPMRELSPLSHNVHLLLCPDDDMDP